MAAAPTTPTNHAREEIAHVDSIDLKAGILEGAKAATEKEQNMTLMEGLRLYPQAVVWSVLISTCIVMEGFDICLLPNFYNFPAFQRKFGAQLSDGTWQVEAKWQVGLKNAMHSAQIVGLLLNGFVSERIGYRWTCLGCLAMVAGFTAILFTAQTVEVLLVGYILSGLPWGVFQTLTVTYASEVCPVALRGYLTSYVNFCWGLGQIIGIGVIRGCLQRSDDWAWRIPYALQWIWPLPLAVGIYMAPESPWWLVRKGKVDQARRSLVRLTSQKMSEKFDPDETIAMIQHTTEMESHITQGSTYLDCFKGTDLRRTEIVCVVWSIQSLAGNSFSGYTAYFLTQAGLDAAKSYNFTIGQYAINMLGVFGAWFLMSRGIGRRTLYLVGLALLFVMLLVMGFLGLPKDREAAALATGCMMILWAVCYQLTIGTVCYSLVSEMSTRRLQIKTVALGRMLYNVVSIGASVITPYMLNPGDWNWGNYAGFFWAGLCACCFVYSYFRLPEPSGRTFAEMDYLFERQIPARKFASTKVDIFNGDAHLEEMREKHESKSAHVEDAKDL